MMSNLIEDLNTLTILLRSQRAGVENSRPRALESPPRKPTKNTKWPNGALTERNLWPLGTFAHLPRHLHGLPYSQQHLVGVITLTLGNYDPRQHHLRYEIDIIGRAEGNASQGPCRQRPASTDRRATRPAEICMPALQRNLICCPFVRHSENLCDCVGMFAVYPIFPWNARKITGRFLRAGLLWLLRAEPGRGRVARREARQGKTRRAKLSRAGPTRAETHEAWGNRTNNVVSTHGSR